MMDHTDLARAAFDASLLPPPPRAVTDALRYVTNLLGMLPPNERAGYVKGPAGGENVAPLADGTLVRVSRVIYPDGQIYKVLSDAPNGNPQWVAEDMRPDLYVPFVWQDGDDPPGPPLDTWLAELVQRHEHELGTLRQQLADFVNWTHEVTKQIGILNEQNAALDRRVQGVEAR